MGLLGVRCFWFHRKIERSMRARLRLVHPDFEIIDNNEDPQLKRVLPVYLRSAGLSLSFMRKYAAQALAEYSGYILGRIPEAIVARHGLMGIAEALGNLHGRRRTLTCALSTISLQWRTGRLSSRNFSISRSA